jgi:hypothetical protein
MGFCLSSTVGNYVCNRQADGNCIQYSESFDESVFEMDVSTVAADKIA